MSKIAIKGATTGTGTFTIESPATNTDRTLTLPDEAGTVVTSASADFAVDVTTTANVGAGTASPAAKLDVHNSSFGGSATTLHLSSTNSASEVIPYAGLGYVVDQGADGIEAGSLTLSTCSSGALAERMRIDSSGRLLVGTTTATGASGSQDHTFHLKSIGTSKTLISEITTTADSSHFFFVNPNGAVGSIGTSGTATAYYTSSDYRLKENVADMTGAITRVKSLAPKRFNFIADDDDTTVDGFLAHEAQTVVPESVSGTHNEVDDEGNPVYQGIDQSKLVPLLTGALQEAIAKIETLETTVADLQTRVTALETP